MESQDSQVYILIVDDEQAILSALLRELRGWSKRHGLSILTASSGEEAEQYLLGRNVNIAILLTDNRMPGMSGAQLVRRVVETRSSAVPLLLTGYTEKHDIQEALSAGIFAFITKPWDRADLMRELDYALESYHLRLRTQNSSRRMREELRAAQEFHKVLFRVPIPERMNDLTLSFFQSCPSKFGVSGDYFDLIGLPLEKHLVLLGDVAGHGLRATFVAAIVKAIVYSEFVRPRLGEPISPAALLEWLNERLRMITEEMPDLFVTFLAGLIDGRSNTITLSAAGAPFPVLVDAGNGIEEIPVHGVALGVKASNSYRDHSLSMAPGDTLYCFTDGMSPTGLKSLAGMDSRQLTNMMLQSIASSDPNGGLESTLNAVQTDLGIAELDDDVTLVRLHRG